jgi:type I restriction enzyme S subunit
MTGWNNVKLGEICSITSSKRIFAKEYQTEGIPFYRGKEIIEKHNGNEVSTELFITRERYEEIKSKFDVPHKGDILLSSVGTLGVSWLVDEEEFYFKDGNLTWLRCNEQTTPEFLYLWLNSPEAQNQIDAMCIGSTQKALTIETLNKFNVALPTLDIQNKICQIINPISQKITVNRATNRNLRDQAQAYFLSMFGNCEKESTVADVSLNVTDGVHNSVKDDLDSDYLLLSCKNIKGGVLTISDRERRIDKATFDKLRKRTQLAKGDVLLSSVGTIGELLLINFEPEKIEFQRSVAMIKPDPTVISSAYLYEALIAQKQEILRAGHGAVQQCIFISDIAKFPIHKPDKEELETFNNVVEPMMDAITVNQNEILRLAVLRDTLLPKLMSGDLDVSDFDV